MIVNLADPLPFRCSSSCARARAHAPYALPFLSPTTSLRPHLQVRLRYASAGAASLLAVALVVFLADGSTGASSLAVAKSAQPIAATRGTSSLEEVLSVWQ